MGSYFYSNGGYIIVGAMLEQITGLDWESLTIARVFGPLGMPNSGFGAPGSPGLPPDAPWGHTQAKIGIEPGPGSDNPAAIGPAGTVHVTLGDYARFMLAHLRAPGVNLLPAPVIDFLQAPYQGIWYAMGWLNFTDPRWVGFGLVHDGSNTIWRARVLLIPSLNAGFLLVTNINVDPPVAFDEIQSVLVTRLLSVP